jgi:predicted phosphodiesterase
MVRSLGIRSVMGNHDDFLLNPDLIRQYMAPGIVGEAVDWCRAQLCPNDLDFIRSFQPEMEVPMGSAGKIRLFHGSPRSHMELILSTTPPDELDAMLAGRTGAVLAGGHTHVQMLRQHRGQLVINVGAVGMPFVEDFKTAALRHEPPTVMAHAEYTVLTVQGGRIEVDLRRVEMPAGIRRATVLDSQMPMREVFAAQYL